MPLRCPDCQTSTLKPDNYADAEVDVCERCQGIWFDNREMEQISEVAAKDLHRPPDALPSQLLCPRCGGTLHLFAYPQTHNAIAMCEQCEGVWIKAANYRALVRFRLDLRARGELERYAPLPGFKGVLLKKIDAAIDELWARIKN